MVLALAAGTLAFADETPLAALVERLGSAEHAPRWAAYLELNGRNDPAVVPLLARALPQYPEMSQYYGVLLIQRHPPALSRAPLRRLATASSVHLRVLAAAALHRQGEVSAAPVIVAGIGSTALDASACVRLLARIHGIRDPRIQAAVRALLTPDADRAVLGQALYSLQQVRDEASIPAVRALLTSDRSTVRALAAACLHSLGDSTHGAVLAQAIASGDVDLSAFQRVKLMLAQARPVPPVVLDAVVALLDVTGNPYLLRTAVELLAEHGYAKAAPAVRKLLDHADATVAKAAFVALAGLPGGITAETMRELLSGGSAERRLAAADALRRADDPSGLEVVLEILGSASLERREAARLLGDFRVARSVGPLIEALLDPDLTVRANAFNSLGAVLRTLYPYRRFDLNTTGYLTSAPEAARTQAVVRLRAWWERHRQADW